MLKPLLVRKLHFVGLIFVCAAAHSVQPTCPDDRYFEPTDTSSTPRDKPSKDFILDMQRARRGNSAAQYNVGLYYEYGHLVTHCIDKAKYWYSRSAANGNVDAQDSLKLIACRARLFKGSGNVGIFTKDMCSEFPQGPPLSNVATIPAASLSGNIRTDSLDATPTAPFEGYKKVREDDCPPGLFYEMCAQSVRQTNSRLRELDRERLQEDFRYERKMRVLENCRREGRTGVGQCPEG